MTQQQSTANLRALPTTAGCARPRQVMAQAGRSLTLLALGGLCLVAACITSGKTAAYAASADGHDKPAAAEQPSDSHSEPAESQNASAGADQRDGAGGSSSASDAIRPEEASAIPLQPESAQEPLPSWISAQVNGSDAEHVKIVSAGPYLSVQECQEALDEELRRATDEFVGKYLGDPRAARRLAIDIDYINQHLRNKERTYLSIRPSAYSGALMHTLYAELRFDDQFRSELASRWEDELARRRLTRLAIVAAGVLGLLLVSHGYFRIQWATGGRYTARLQLVAAGMILTLVTAGVLVARFTGWM